MNQCSTTVDNLTDDDDDTSPVLLRNKVDDDTHDDKKETIITCHHPSVTNISHAMHNNSIPNRFDRWLTFYTNFVSKSINQDKLLKLLQWSLYIASISVLEIAYSNNRIKGSNQADSSRSSTVNHVSSGLRKLYSEISMARYVIRLLGFPTALEAFRNNSWTIQSNYEHDESNKNHNAYYYWIGKVLAGSMVLYYPTELLAYVHWMAPQLFPPSLSTPRTGNRWSYISCRFWVLYILAELMQCLMQRDELRRQQLAVMENENKNNHSQKINQNDLSLSSTSVDKIVVVSETEDSHDDNSSSDDIHSRKQNNKDDLLEPIAASYRSNQLQIYRNLLFLLPCINWSLPNWDVQPWLNEKTVNILMWLESVVCIHQAIMNQK
jgi:hypothetical protein